MICHSIDFSVQCKKNKQNSIKKQTTENLFKHWAKPTCFISVARKGSFLNGKQAHWLCKSERDIFDWGNVNWDNICMYINTDLVTVLFGFVLHDFFYSEDIFFLQKPCHLCFPFIRSKVKSTATHSCWK